jgi:hypothetical protein
MEGDSKGQSLALVLWAGSIGDRREDLARATGHFAKNIVTEREFSEGAVLD